MLELLPYNLLPPCNNVITFIHILPISPSIITQYITWSCEVMTAKPLSPSHSVNGQTSLLHIHHLYSLILHSTPYNMALNT